MSLNSLLTLSFGKLVFHLLLCGKSNKLTRVLGFSPVLLFPHNKCPRCRTWHTSISQQCHALRVTIVVTHLLWEVPRIVITGAGHVGLHPLNQCCDDLRCSDLVPELHQILKMPHQRPNLAFIAQKRNVICLTSCLVHRRCAHHGRHLSDQSLSRSSPVKNKKQSRRAKHVHANCLRDNCRAVMDKWEAKQSNLGELG